MRLHSRPSLPDLEFHHHAGLRDESEDASRTTLLVQENLAEWGKLARQSEPFFGNQTAGLARQGEATASKGSKRPPWSPGMDPPSTTSRALAVHGCFEWKPRECSQHSRVDGGARRERHLPRTKLSMRDKAGDFWNATRRAYGWSLPSLMYTSCASPVSTAPPDLPCVGAAGA